MSRDAFARTGAESARAFTRWLIRLEEPLTSPQRQEAERLADVFGQQLTVETGPPTLDDRVIRTSAAVGAGMLSLLIVGIGLALISAETRRDETMLTAVGAAPRTRRDLAASRAGVLTLLGAVLSVPAGLLPIWGLSTAATSRATAGLTVPGTTIVGVVLVVPPAAVLAAWLFTRPASTAITPGSEP